MRKKTPLLLAAVISCGSAMPSVADPTLVGIWYSPYQPDEPNVMSLIEFRADGTFHEEFRKCDDGNFIGYQTESGTWSVMGDLEQIVTDRINGDPAKVEGSYKILVLTDFERRIRLEPQGYVFIGHRVQNFEFPDCANGA